MTCSICIFRHEMVTSWRYYSHMTFLDYIIVEALHFSVQEFKIEESKSRRKFYSNFSKGWRLLSKAYKCFAVLNPQNPQKPMTVKTDKFTWILSIHINILTKQTQFPIPNLLRVLIWLRFETQSLRPKFELADDLLESNFIFTQKLRETDLSKIAFGVF